MLSNVDPGDGPSHDGKEKPIQTHKCCSRSVLSAVLLGQLLSVCLCGTAVTSGLLQREGVNIPTAQSFFNYFLMCATYTILLACRNGENTIAVVLKSRGWKYILLAVIDVEANYMVVKAYSYTTITSVQLLDCFSIPTVVFLSVIILRMKYGWTHIVGVLVSLTGIGCIILSDVLVKQHNQDNAPNQPLGDILCLSGSILYGVSNIIQEFVVKNFDHIEFLGMLGLFGSIVSGVQVIILERTELAKVDFSSFKTVLFLLGFAVCLYLFYSLMTIAMKMTSATSVNISTLSADFYTLLFGLFLFHYQFHVLYFVAFVLVIVGVFVYTAWPTGKRLKEERSPETFPILDSPESEREASLDAVHRRA